MFCVDERVQWLEETVNQLKEEKKFHVEALAAATSRCEVVGTRAFMGCKNLESITFRPFYDKRQITFMVYFSRKFDKNYPEPMKLVSSFAGWGTLKKIRSEAFYGCTSLSSVIIPNSVTAIGHWAFSFCSSLTSITLPDSLKTIPGRTFWSCSSLTSIELPNTMTTIEDAVFHHCTSLKSIKLPDTVTTIGEAAFY